MAHIRRRSGDRYWDGGRPALGKTPVTKLGRSAESQRTDARYAALSDLGSMTMALPGGGYLEGDERSLDWLLEHGLVELLPPRRPGGARQVVRTAEGDRVREAWQS